MTMKKCHIRGLYFFFSGNVNLTFVFLLLTIIAPANYKPNNVKPRVRANALKMIEDENVY